MCGDTQAACERISWRWPDADQEVRRRQAHGGGHVRDGRPPREDPQRRVGRPFRRGKTTLVEALLAATGTITRAGTVADGTTVSDADPVEVAQQRSVALSVCPLAADDIVVNLLDTPGYPDFTGELRAGLRAADAALFVVSAAEDIDPITSTLWEECAALGTPRAVVMTRLDTPRASFDDCGRRLPARVRRGRRAGRAAALPARRARARDGTGGSGGPAEPPGATTTPPVSRRRCPT